MNDSLSLTDKTTKSTITLPYLDFPFRINKPQDNMLLNKTN